MVSATPGAFVWGGGRFDSPQENCREREIKSRLDGALSDVVWWEVELDEF